MEVTLNWTFWTIGFWWDKGGAWGIDLGPVQLVRHR